VLEILGRGGMGVVFRAYDPALDREVALKAMRADTAVSPQAGQRFVREARAAAGIAHDHVIHINHVGEENGVPFLVMPLLRGETLAQRLQRCKHIPLREVLRIGREVAEGLAAAHQRNLIHRDIKPGNIWLEAHLPARASWTADEPAAESEGGRVKVLDFGLARPADDTPVTLEGNTVGTPAYMAPEQARGERVDGRCDLFSLGCVLYHLATGVSPFHRPSQAEMHAALLTETVLPPHELNPGVPPELSELVMRLLAKEPEGRPSSADTVVGLLRNLEWKLVLQTEAVPTVEFNTPGPERAVAPGQATPEHKPEAPARGIAIKVMLAAAAAGALVLLVAGMVLYWPTADGTVRIEINDPDLKVALDNGGFIITGAEKNNIILAPGKHALHVKRGDLEFDTDKFVLKKGDTVTLRVEVLKGKVQVVQDEKVIGERPLVRDTWPEQVAGLPAEKQVEAVAAKLKERNPGFDGQVTPKIEGGVVTELWFGTDDVTDISPVRALTGLRLLACAGSARGKGQLADLAPLADLHLTVLSCPCTKVSDLSPLRGMKLTRLDCTSTRVSDLTPLVDMPLTLLFVADTPVSDLSPLKGVPLTLLACGSSKVSDLAPLVGMKLTHFGCEHTNVSDLSPLKGMPLIQLGCSVTRVSDLSPLVGMKLTLLDCTSTKVFDLSPLKDMPLTHLFVADTPVSDLSPLVGVPLLYLSCNSTPVSDLSPLAGTKLLHLSCDNTKVTDLSPLKDMPLTKLLCDFKPERDAALLRSLKTLQTINGKPAAEFWKEQDAKQPANRP
jgi:hypothetical protein